MTASTSVFVPDGDWFVPTGLARGPWDANAQHGGAPAALLAHVAEATVADSAFMLTRLTFELTRPVPIAPLKVHVDAGRGRSARRLQLALEHDSVTVGRASALLLRETPLAFTPQADAQLLPGPRGCTERFAVPGLADAHPGQELFGGDAIDAWIARGSSHAPGPAAAWFRLRAPVVAGHVDTPAMRVMAAADFGNGISWVLPPHAYWFTNADLTVYLQRTPVGEWIGLDSATVARATGMGLATSTLYDTRGRIGMAHQTLLIRPR